MPCSTPLLVKYADQGVFNLDDVSVLRIPPLTELGTPVQLINAFGGKDKFVCSRPRPASRALPGDRVTRVRPHPRQIDSGYHASGLRRGRRRPAHQPVVLDVLPQDHRRSGPGTGVDAGGLQIPDPEAVPVARLGSRPRGYHRRRLTRLHQQRPVPGPEESPDDRPTW